ncbi:MAG: hypothetical protein MUP33_08585, partial [Polaromonas sp.]|nr:hypothetical protein [Polaromonas sp.]
MNELVVFTTIPDAVYVKVESAGSFDGSASYRLTVEGSATSTAGAKIWESLTGGAIRSAPAVWGDRVY